MPPESHKAIRAGVVAAERVEWYVRRQATARTCASSFGPDVEQLVKNIAMSALSCRSGCSRRLERRTSWDRWCKIGASCVWVDAVQA